MRYFLTFSYNGINYHGWQKQPNAITVQEVLENAISTLLRKKLELVAAGRTDAGVHAKVMVAHFDFEDEINTSDLIYKLNAFLPEDIAVKKIVRVKNDAHARFDATERTYEYWITQEKNPFLAQSAYYVKYPLDVAAMNQAAKVLFEFTNFKCFSKSNTDVKTFECTITHAKWEKVGDKLVFTISANRFLRNMVRAIVGTLLDVGYGKSTIEDVKNIIKSKNRSNAGASVPGHALYLTAVTYPETVYNVDE